MKNLYISIYHHYYKGQENWFKLDKTKSNKNFNNKKNLIK